MPGVPDQPNQPDQAAYVAKQKKLSISLATYFFVLCLLYPLYPMFNYRLYLSRRLSSYNQRMPLRGIELCSFLPTSVLIASTNH
jgi:hypothetical protein